jgi:hypothetical protein
MLAKMETNPETMEVNQNKIDTEIDTNQTKMEARIDANNEKFEVLRSTIVSQMDIRQARTGWKPV